MRGLDDWELLGQAGVSIVFIGLLSVVAPELGPVDLDDVFEGKGGRLLQWQLQQADGYPFVP